MPFIVLAKYYPPWEPQDWRAWKIGRALVAITNQLGFKPHVDPAHGPEERASWIDETLHAQVRRFNFDGPGGDWHQDGDTTPGARMNCAMILWTNVAPTEFKFLDNPKIYRPRALELVLIRNLECFHRRPAGAPKARWTFRQRVQLP